jgi:hypothetical protein
MMKYCAHILLTTVFFGASVQISMAQTTNTACVWGLARMAQVFEEVCHPEERNEYRATLDESVLMLLNRTRELGTVPEVDRVSDEVKGHIAGMSTKDPAFCQSGHLFDMSRRMRERGVEALKQDVSKTLAVPRERQVNGCL